MVRDLPRHLLPEGAVFDATNIVITNSGSLAKRGAAPTALAATTSAAPDAIGAQRSANTDGRSRLYTSGVTSGGVLRFGSMTFSNELQTLHSFTSQIAMQALVDSDPMAKKIAASYFAFADKVRTYHEISERAYLNGRDRLLPPVQLTGE